MVVPNEDIINNVSRAAEKDRKRVGRKRNDRIVRVALYIRVSTEEQAVHGFSLAAQEEALISFAEENGYKIVGIYKDEGISGRKPVLKRPAMLQLLSDVEAGKVDLIAFTKIDRWFRSVGDFHTVQKILDKHGVMWKTILEDYGTNSADARFKTNIMLSVAGKRFWCACVLR